MSSDGNESAISVNRELDRIIIGDTAIALYGEHEGEFEIVDTHKNASWVEFEADGTRVSLEFEEVRTEGMADAE